LIRVAVMYPNKTGATFDDAYYANKHMKLVVKKLKPLGLVKVEIDKGVSGMPPGSKPPYLTVGYLIFNTMEELQKSNSLITGELANDIPNFTNVQPLVQISETTM
jgi:uncharacterized protein (TIGR02118 family)